MISRIGFHLPFQGRISCMEVKCRTAPEKEREAQIAIKIATTQLPTAHMVWVGGVVAASSKAIINGKQEEAEGRGSGARHGRQEAHAAERSPLCLSTRLRAKTSIRAQDTCDPDKLDSATGGWAENLVLNRASFTRRKCEMGSWVLGGDQERCDLRDAGETG